MKIKSAVIVTAAFLVLPPQACQAWWSFPAGSASHAGIGTEAIQLIGGVAGDAETPDLKLPGSYVWRWMTGPGNDESAHGKDDFHGDAGMYNGGSIDRWWGIDNRYPGEGVLPQ